MVTRKAFVPRRNENSSEISSGKRMKSPTNQEITWSIVELNGLLEDEDSHVHVVRTMKHLALHPYHLNNIQQGLNQILKSLLHTYDREYVLHSVYLSLL